MQSIICIIRQADATSLWLYIVDQNEFLQADLTDDLLSIHWPRPGDITDIAEIFTTTINQHHFTILMEERCITGSFHLLSRHLSRSEWLMFITPDIRGLILRAIQLISLPWWFGCCLCSAECWLDSLQQQQGGRPGSWRHGSDSQSQTGTTFFTFKKSLSTWYCELWVHSHTYVTYAGLPATPSNNVLNGPLTTELYQVKASWSHNWKARKLKLRLTYWLPNFPRWHLLIHFNPNQQQV